jgi:hypothetical protein
LGKEAKRSVDEGRSLKGDSSREKKRGKRLRGSRSKMRREKMGEFPDLLRGLYEGFYRSTSVSRYMKVISICQ